MEEKEILKEAMERIEFEIEDSLKNKQTTIAGRIDVEIVKHQLQAYKDKEDKLREYCKSNRGYVQGYGFVYREDEKLQEVKNDILEILGE